MTDSEKIRVLIVDDDLLVIKMVRSILGRTENRYTIVGEAYNGQEGVALTKQFKPDVILLDIRMPQKNGIETAQQIYDECPTPVVFLTAYDEPDLVKKASEAGAGAFLTKPPQPREIDRAITIAMARFSDMVKLRRLNAELQEALDKVKTLEGLLPICASCKRIRNETGQWEAVETYIEHHSHVEFSHGLCPECAQKLYPTIFKE